MKRLDSILALTAFLAAFTLYVQTLAPSLRPPELIKLYAVERAGSGLFRINRK